MTKFEKACASVRATLERVIEKKGATAVYGFLFSELKETRKAMRDLEIVGTATTEQLALIVNNLLSSQAVDPDALATRLLLFIDEVPPKRNAPSNPPHLKPPPLLLTPTR